MNSKYMHLVIVVLLIATFGISCWTLGFRMATWQWDNVVIEAMAVVEASSENVERAMVLVEECKVSRENP